MTIEKYYPKNISQWKFCYGLSQIYRELLSLATFLWVYLNSKEVSYLSWQKMYPNLKTICHIKVKLFLWTKLLESLLLAKYHCVKSVEIRSFFWSVFSRIWTKYGEIRSISTYSVQMWENKDQKKLRIWTLLTQCISYLSVWL